MSTILTLVLGLALGAGVSRIAQPLAVSAQMMSPMPMASGSCPMMQSMMTSAQTPGDRALMQSMMAMHQSMSGMKLSGDADRDFLAMMIPHHQSAIDMANAEMQYGKDAKVKALARQIVSAQQQEITQMHDWLNARL
jgi:uncharacterized protein (DUF305 family)